MLCDAYDAGKTVAALSLAVDLRVLLHDNPKKNSHSLLQQLGKKGVLFLDSSELPPFYFESAYLGLSGFAIGPTLACYVPHLDGLYDHEDRRLLPFNMWWTQIVIRDAQGQGFTREDIVWYVANQDGGAHVDPSLDQEYSNLSRQNSVGFEFWSSAGPRGAMENIERTAIRQIAHEVLRTFLLDYPIKKTKFPLGTNSMYGPIMFGKIAPPPRSNDPCPCGTLEQGGTKRQYGRCHGI